MNTANTYSVADLPFEVRVPGNQSLEALLPAFRDFEAPGQAPLFILDASEEVQIPQSHQELTLVDSADNEAGRVRLFRAGSTYLLRLSFGDPVHTALFSIPASLPEKPSAADGIFKPSESENGTEEEKNGDRKTDDGIFKERKTEDDREVWKISACIQWQDPQAGNALSSVLRIVFAQAVLLRGGLSIHASSVVADGRAYLFLGPSGTGKSTHSRLWLSTFAGTELLNDDNPALRVNGGQVRAYGTPWSGKTPCHRNLSAPLGGIVRLRQAPEDSFRLLDEAEAFSALLPSCTAIRRDPVLHEALCDNVAAAAAASPVAILDCLPHEAAARLCRNGLEAAARTASHQVPTAAALSAAAVSSGEPGLGQEEAAIKNRKNK